MPKLVYIAHPINGNQKQNVESVLRICREVHSAEIVPFAPYLVTLNYLNDDVFHEREMGIRANLELFSRKTMDEVWLCGPTISNGMKREIQLALEKDIPIRCHNSELEPKLNEIKRAFGAQSHVRRSP